MHGTAYRATGIPCSRRTRGASIGQPGPGQRRAGSRWGPAKSGCGERGDSIPCRGGMPLFGSSAGKSGTPFAARRQTQRAGPARLRRAQPRGTAGTAPAEAFQHPAEGDTQQVFPPGRCRGLAGAKIRREGTQKSRANGRPKRGLPPMGGPAGEIFPPFYPLLKNPP